MLQIKLISFIFDRPGPMNNITIPPITNPYYLNYGPAWTKPGVGRAGPARADF